MSGSRLSALGYRLSALGFRLSRLASPIEIMAGVCTPCILPARRTRWLSVVARMPDSLHRLISARTISQAISRAVRDFGSGRYVDPSGMRESTLRVASASFFQNFRKCAFSSIDPPIGMLSNRHDVLLGLAIDLY